jgi:hypothetical protein
MRSLLLISALAIPFAFGAGFGPSASAAKSVTYRYAVHYQMTHATDARPAAKWLQQHGFDIAGLNVRKQEIEVITDDHGLALLANNGYTGRIIDRAIDGRLLFGPDARYLNPTTASQKLQDLAKQYPAMTRLEQVGTSLQNRPILALLVSTTPGKDDPAAALKPSIVFDGQHHAREIMTSEIVMDVADNLLAGYAAGDAEAKKILDGWNVWVLPMLNVDGTNIVFTTDNMWRKNASSANGQVVGTDINRNYPYKWAACNGSSTSTGAEDYHGTAAASEPETKALMGLWDMAHPTASMSYHSYSQLVLYPYGCDGVVSGDNALEDKVAKELAALLPNDSGGGNYEPGTPWAILYAVDGDSMDYVFAQFGALTYTFEVNEEFQPSYDMRAPTLAKHEKAWKYFFDRASGNLLSLKVTDGTTGKAAPAQISINTIPHVQQEQPFTTNSSGMFFKVLDPGTYILTVKLGDGRQSDVTVTMNGQPQSVTANIK